MSSHSNWNSSFLSDPNPEITTELAVGMTLGKYLLTEEIGRGGVGIVYQALHQTLNIPVAVKVLRPDKLADDPDILEQFRVEARLLAQLNHPNLVRVWDFEDDPQMPYLVLEYVGGSNLLDLTLQCGGLGVAKALRFCIQVADGLGEALEHSIIHRDVKPANVLITRDGTAKLTDLGQAAIHDAVNHDEKLKSPTTVQGGGTPAYMAPEQFLHECVADHRADIYALGVSLYQLLSGRLPFEATTFSEMMIQHVKGEPRPLSEVAPRVPPSVWQIIQKMIAKDPEDRYQTYQDLIRDLRTALHMETQENIGDEASARGCHTTESRFASAASTDVEIRLPEKPPLSKPSSTEEVPDEASVSKMLKVGMIAARGGKRQLACQLLRDALQMDPDNELALLMLAQTTENVEEAQKTYQRLLQVNPNNAPAKIALRALEQNL